MKESKLIQMFNKINHLEKLIDEVIKEVIKTQNMTIGTLEVLKRMPNYEKALKKLKKDNKEKDEKNVEKGMEKGD
tara:strand:+ start:756 stop:980 length:225 start_codon:yes stop_codon:yes gene_type:complete